MCDSWCAHADFVCANGCPYETIGPMPPFINTFKLSSDVTETNIRFQRTFEIQKSFQESIPRSWPISSGFYLEKRRIFRRPCVTNARSLHDRLIQRHPLRTQTSSLNTPSDHQRFSAVSEKNASKEDQNNPFVRMCSKWKGAVGLKRNKKGLVG